MAPALERIGDRNRLVDDVHARLREAIFTGGIPPGSRLGIPALATRLGVSRSPVREAVLRLVQEGLAVEEPHKGAVVVQLDVEQLLGVYAVRAVLEGLAARLAAMSEKDPQSGLAISIERHVAAVEKQDLGLAFEADLEFHRALREMTGNAQLSGFLEQIQGKVRLAMTRTIITPGPHLAVADHQAIYDAIVAGDADRAEKVARAHIARLRRVLASSAGYRMESTATDW